MLLAKGRTFPGHYRNLLNFIDPLMLNLARHEVSLSTGQDFSLAVEGVVAAHLLRNFEYRLFEGFGSIEKVFYWRSAKGKEVDFVVLHGESLFPVFLTSMTSSEPVPVAIFSFASFSSIESSLSSSSNWLFGMVFA